MVAGEGRSQIVEVRDDPAAESVPRCRAYRLPDALVEPPFEAFQPF
ncbi:hypothetical protein [Plantactinospora sp. B5E13]